MKDLSHIFPVTRENMVLGMRERRKFIVEKYRRNQVQKQVDQEELVRWARS